MRVTPNQISALRVGLAFAAVVLFGHNPWANLMALALTITAIALDGVDGYLARRYKLSTPLGAQIDILGDRVIENLFFTFFAVCGLVSMWVPVMFFVRGTLTDFIRGLAARAGKVGFGKNSMLESWWARELVASRASRGAYAALKCACFCYLGLELTLLRGSRVSEEVAGRGLAAWFGLVGAHSYTPIQLGADILVTATVAFCLVRGLPVIWEGRRYLAALAHPSSARPNIRVPHPRAARVGLPAGGARRGLSVPQGAAGR